MRRVAVLIGSTTDGGAKDGTGGDYSGTLESVDESFRAYLEAAGIQPVFYDEAVRTRDCEAAMAMTHATVDGKLLDALGPQIKLISNYGVGVNHIDLEECTRRGIPVGNTPDVLSDATADLAWALLLACARRIPECDTLVRSPAFTEYQNMLLLGGDVAGKTLGVLGMGRIGREVARRGIGFRMTTLYHNRSRQPEAVEREVNARWAPLDELLASSDFVVLTCPLTEDTVHLIDASALRRMKSSATLVNVARGGVVDQEALLAALQANDGTGIHMAGLDVSTPEPLPRDHPLLSRPDVVWTPHRGSATAGTRKAMAELAIRNLMLGLDGKKLAACCNGLGGEPFEATPAHEAADTIDYDEEGDTLRSFFIGSRRAQLQSACEAVNAAAKLEAARATFEPWATAMPGQIGAAIQSAVEALGALHLRPTVIKKRLEGGVAASSLELLTLLEHEAFDME
jgi:glyoxylate reductase